MTERKVTIEQYQAAIPTCCEYQTAEEHAKYLMLCWGLMLSIERREQMDCRHCEYATRKIVLPASERR